MGKIQIKKRASAGEQRQGQGTKIDDFEYNYNTSILPFCQEKSFIFSYLFQNLTFNKGDCC